MWLCRVGLQQPTVEVRYHNVSVETSAVVGDRRIPTLVRTVTSRLEVRLPLRGGGGCLFSVGAAVESDSKGTRW